MSKTHTAEPNGVLEHLDRALAALRTRGFGDEIEVQITVHAGGYSFDPDPVDIIVRGKTKRPIPPPINID